MQDVELVACVMCDAFVLDSYLLFDQRVDQLLEPSGALAVT